MAVTTPLDQQPFVVVDLETTGGSAVYDRIIEVAAVRVVGGVVQDRLESLVDPGVSIPPFIARLTGISNSMVRGKPPIELMLPHIERFTDGAVVVAHNASFDYGFLNNAFSRSRRSWSRDTACTLRLARRLIAGLHSYKLDSLCAHLGLHYVQRHRAAPDAEATLSLFNHLLHLADERDIDNLADLLALQSRPVSAQKRKGRVDEAVVASLSNGPGVYLLKDQTGHVVYVGKSVNVRTRVRQHLRPSGTAATAGQPALRKRLPYIADVEAIETGSELEALFLESKLVKRYLPEGNRKLRDYRDYPFVKVDTSDPHPRLTATRERPAEDALYFGPFRRAGQVASAVQFLTEQLGLRQCKGPLVPGQAACALLELGKCLGPCVGAVTDEQYAEAVNEAVRLVKGEGTGLVERLTARRDELADELRFEEAAELRDRIKDLEALVRAQRKLNAVSERNLVVVAPAAQPDQGRLFVVKDGRLVREVSVPLRARPAALRGVLKSAFQQSAEGPVSRDEVDDMFILDSWLRTHESEAHEVSVCPSDPEAALPALREALACLAQPAPAKQAS